MGTTERRVVWVDGTVQGVGFRWWVSGQAGRLGLVGHARNLADGRVEVDAQGAPEDVAALVEALTARPGPSGRPGHVAGWVSERRTPDASVTRFTTG